MTSQPPAPAAARNGWAIAIAVASLAAALPFLRGVAAGHVLYFRDLSVLFHPFRLYVIEGLRAGELRYWDPYVHEGVPLLYPPLAYPLDLLQALWADPRSVSLLLALHVPLAATAMVLLARRLGLSSLASTGSGIVYALGGFALSTLNLYVYVEAMAWAPIVVLALRTAGRGRGRALAGAALAVAIVLSTLGVEIALQAIVVGLALAARPRRWRALARPLLATALGLGLAAPVVLVMRANMAAGERARGFSVDVVLNQSVHPFTLLQTLVADLYGDLSHLPDRWWGSNFFDRGFPYILSLYVGGTVIALALTALAVDRRRTARISVLAVLALWIALGRWGGLGAVLAVLPEPWRVFRFPTKAFFTVHLCVALLAATGLHHLQRRRGGRTFVIAAIVLGSLLTLAPLAPRIFPGRAAWFLAQFFPPAIPPATRVTDLREILASAMAGGVMALVAAAVVALTLAERLRPWLGAALVTAIATGDLLRAGAGLNPMIDPQALGTSPEVLSAMAALPDLQRVYSCDPETSRAYWEVRRQRPHDHEALTLWAWADTLTPHVNRTAHVLSALGQDLTSLVPLSRLPVARGCGNPDSALPRLRAAGVSHILALEPVLAPGFVLVAEPRPPRLAPLHVFVYRVPDPVPLRFVARTVRGGEPPPGAVPSPERVWVSGAPADVDGAAGSVRSLHERPDRLELEVEATRPTALVVLDGWAAGWAATVDGAASAVLRAGEHRAVWVPAGHSRLTLTYSPPGLRAGLVLFALSAVLVALAYARDRAPVGSKTGRSSSR